MLSSLVALRPLYYSSQCVWSTCTAWRYFSFDIKLVLYCLKSCGSNSHSYSGPLQAEVLSHLAFSALR